MSHVWDLWRSAFFFLSNAFPRSYLLTWMQLIFVGLDIEFFLLKIDLCKHFIPFLFSNFGYYKAEQPFWTRLPLALI